MVALLFLLPLGSADAQNTATDGLFTIGYSEGFGLDSWYSEGEVFLSHLFQQSFFFRTDQPGDFNDLQEYPIEALTFNSVSNTDPATGSPAADKIYLSLGDPGSDPFGADILYDLTETGPGGTGATLSATITLTNFSTSTIGVSLWSYTDLDIDNSPSGDLAQLVSANTIRQTSFVGSSVTTRVASGPNPNLFDIRSYPEILNDLEDDTQDELLNNNAFGPADATHAFQWDLTLGAAPISITVEHVGAFAEFVFPTSTDGESFTFSDPDAPAAGDAPRWYDPVVAVGYEYVAEPGTEFAELYLPEGFLDSAYELEVTDPEHDAFGQVFQIIVSEPGAMSFSFVAADGQGDGARSFRVTGIEPEAGIDPTDPLGFPTGLTFVGGGQVGFTQSALSIPEPGTLLLLGCLTPLVLRRR
ncbi:hypothetical protein [Botrimarina sp.]|uniref:hypothetical protein n=1 Tax=Botrimarina sp. TaxID=2795802 RepID=UPI0032EE20D9